MEKSAKQKGKALLPPGTKPSWSLLDKPPSGRISIYLLSLDLCTFLLYKYVFLNFVYLIETSEMKLFLSEFLT